MSSDPGIHPEFKINSKAYNAATILKLAEEYLRTGSEYEKKVAAFLQAWCSQDPYIVVRTSGSTGDPKSIQLLKAHMVHSAQATGSYFKLMPGNRALLSLSADTIAGKMMLVRAMVLGLNLDIIAPSSTPLTHTSASYDFCAMVPLQLRHSLNLIHRVKTLIVGGAVLPADLKHAVRNFKTRVYETFGMTETSSHIALKKINPAAGDQNPDYMDSFETLPGVKVNVDDRGCLVIQAPEIAGEDLVTNDLVEILTPRKFIWLGRWDHVINSGGVKLIPEVIEKKLSTTIASRFVIGSLPDEALGERLVLVVEGSGDVDVLYQDVKKVKELDRYEMPKQLFFMEEFPETRSGKPNRVEILRQLSDRISSGTN